ncbi:hypothetical protein C8R31_10241 [Nitrosospira sp. Nsp2]|uniref:hypothetical protein n=1 Tax=Nitrosospira sp. Nsp2 TaxID=136548 RepID=UPI000D31289F|nr:hypothetical protein [Nitrosospira sp. Nsp2]PTR16027.1 hypothetical protein C8R31_10241 [Nitrosospira sp. Nsp2]
MNRLSGLCIILPLCVIVTGCAGFRGGWESAAYFDGTAPVAPQRQRSTEGPELNLPGLNLHVGIDNRLQTYDTQIFFGLPLSVDPRNLYPKNYRPGKTRVFVDVTPRTGGFVFRPLLASLVIGSTHYPAVRGFEFGMWDAEGQQTNTGGVWDHRDVGGGVSLTEPHKRYRLSLEFDIPVPSPKSPDILLDLSRALQDLGSVGDPPLPLIRFAPVKWEEGYT